MKKNILLALLVVPAMGHSIVGGAIDTAFTGVFAYPGGNGVAVGALKMMTAKHLGGGVGSSFSYLGQTFTVASRIENPVADFAILNLTSTGSGFSTHYRVLDNSKLGESATIVGFGDFNTGVSASGYTGITSKDGQRRAGTTFLDSKNTFALPATFNSPVTGQSSAASSSYQGSILFNGDAGVAGGDSGGGWFQEIDGEQLLIATSSFRSRLNTSLPYYQFDGNTSSGGVALQDYTSFLTQNGVEVVPEPASLIALGAGVLALIRRRKTKASRN